jgi:hypothetical protein
VLDNIPSELLTTSSEGEKEKSLRPESHTMLLLMLLGSHFLITPAIRRRKKKEEKKVGSMTTLGDIKTTKTKSETVFFFFMFLKTAVAHVFVINVSNRCCLQAERTSRHIG